MAKLTAAVTWEISAASTAKLANGWAASIPSSFTCRRWRRSRSSWRSDSLGDCRQLRQSKSVNFICSGEGDSAASDDAGVSLLIPVMKRKKPARQKEEDFHHNVYVVLLNDVVAKHPSILRLNPKRDPLKPCVYVGMTGIPVDHRFENHKNGYKSAWVVRKYGVRLMPELYEHLNPMPFEAAVQMETELAEELRAAGYTVTGGH